MTAPGTELALGLIHDPALRPLLIISVGGVLVEIFSERSVVLPPVTRCAALGINPLICGPSGALAVDILAVPLRSSL